jgi:small ligand-binding sensory domain FIST
MAGVTRFGDGLEVDLDLVRAADVAAGRALEPLDGRRPDLVCVFVCGDDPSETADALLRAGELAGGRTTVGCSASGVIGGGRAVEVTPAVSVWAAALPGVALRGFHLEVLHGLESAAVVGMPSQVAEDSVAVLLADPYSFPATGFLARSADTVPGVALVGGLAAGLHGAGSTRLLLDGHVHERGAVGVVLDGVGVRARPLVSQGCRPIGAPMTVTQARGNSLVTLAGRPAMERLEAVVAALPPSEQALVAGGVHLGIAMDEYADEHERGDFLVRPVVGADRASGALLVGDLVPTGATVRFHVRDAGSAGSALAAELAELRAGGPLDAAVGALLFSCVARGSAMFADPAHDVAAVRAGLPVDAVAGFFAGGEIGPVGGRNHLHGTTACLLVFGTPR